VDPLARAPACRARSRVVLGSVKAFALVVLFGVVVATGPPASTPDRPAVRPGIAQAADRPDCAAALIRTAQGTVRRVSFAVGWDVYTGRRPGTLIAACLDGRLAAEPGPARSG
jgi:hypothetical protein